MYGVLSIPFPVFTFSSSHHFSLSFPLVFSLSLFSTSLLFRCSSHFFFIMANKKEKKEAVTSDSRFKSVHNDPRFKLPSLKNFKVKVDERFSKNELKKLNASYNGKAAKIDRYGRKIKQSDNSGVDKFYEHESDEEKEEEKSEEKSDLEDESDLEEESENDKEQLVKRKSLKDDNLDDLDDLEEDLEPVVDGFDRARGEGLESSDSESDSDSDSDSVDLEDSEIELEESKPEEGDPTSGFAVVNLDWDNVRAVDLMATFVSFVPKNGTIKSVTVYPSEYGREQMQKEEIEGPPRELFKSKKKKDDDSDSDDDLDLNNPADVERATRKLYEEDNGEEDYDSKALRRYQLQRLRYYYAIVKCDSVETAKTIYNSCDGTEYEATANIFDLRYVPEDMEFDDEPRDTCTKVPASYKPNSTFVTDALQHSKVKLTWDETPKERLQFSSKQFSQKEIDDMDFKAYLASDTDESENEDADKYKNLLGAGIPKFGKDDDEVDMEITFNSGLGDAKVESDEPVVQESTIEAYKRKERERRKERKERLKAQKAAEKAEKEVKDDSKAEKKGNKGKKADDKSKDVELNGKAEIDDDKKKAELELLMMNEGEDEHNHFNMKDVIRSEKQNKRKGKKGKAKIDSEMVQDDFKVDLNDDRFAEVFEDHSFAIDPTNSEFKKTETMKRILEERSKRKGNQSHKKNKKQKTSDLSSLVNKVKGEK